MGDLVELAAWNIDETNARPGGSLKVTLYWHALTPIPANYQAFVHMYDGTMRGQSDHAPECDVNPTTRWEPGQVIPDTHIVNIAPDAPLNQPVPVYAGLYGLVDLIRLPVGDAPLSPAPDPPPNSIYLTEVTLKP